MFNAPRKSPATHYPRVYRQFVLVSTSRNNCDFAQWPKFVGVGGDREESFRLLQIVLPRRFREPLAIEIELVRLIHELQSARIQGRFAEVDADFRLHLREKLSRTRRALVSFRRDRKSTRLNSSHLGISY